MGLHFSEEEFKSRKSKVLNSMKEQNIDALLMFKQESMYWLTGYDTFGYVFFQTLILDKNGNITTDANKALKGTQLPMATFKGSGLAWMVDILSGVLTGSSHSGKTKDPFDDYSGSQNMGHLFITINPKVFSGNNFLKEMKKNILRVKKLPKAKGFKTANKELGRTTLES